MKKLAYYYLRFWFRICLRLFYRRLTVHGREHRNLKGPFIVTSNHPNTLIDALIVGIELRQRIGFLGNASLFRDPKMAAIMHFLGVIPIYRKEDLKEGETMQNNDDAFRTAYAHLRAGGAFLVFPEGTSIVGRKLLEIRTGTARIALGYEENMGFKGGLKLLTISLNYSSSTHFRTRVHVNINAPISVADYEQSYREDPRATVRNLTNDLAESLSDGLVILDDMEQERMFHQILRLSRVELDGPKELLRPSRGAFEKEKATAEALRGFKRNSLEKYEVLRRHLDMHFGLLDRLGVQQSVLGDRNLRWNPLLLVVLTGLALLLLLPFALLGLVAGLIPYRIVSWLPPKIAKDIEYRTPIMLMAGMFLFPLFFALETLAFYLIAGDALSGWWSLGLLALLPVSGWLSLVWLDNVERFQGLMRLLWMGGRKGTTGKRLRARRKELLGELKELGI